MTSSKPINVRIFVSSPADVNAERQCAKSVIRRLKDYYIDRVAIETIAWEEDVYSAHEHPQMQIDSPATVDIVICVLWKSLGTVLPSMYDRSDGTSRTGTEYEFEVARSAACVSEDGGTPFILMYRSTASLSIAPTEDQVSRLRSDLRCVEMFWQRWFQSADGHAAGAFKCFSSMIQFETELEGDLSHLIERKLQASGQALIGSPYRGLDSYEPGHSQIFFGRKRAAAKILARMKASASRQNPKVFQLLVGASGAGKSSLAKAGVVPTLLEQGVGIATSRKWRHLIIRPKELASDGSNDPCSDPANRLSDLVRKTIVLDQEHEEDRISEMHRWDRNENVWHWSQLREEENRVVKGSLLDALKSESALRLILVIDQLEEMFQYSCEQQLEFGRLLSTLVRHSAGRVWVIATLRSDYYSNFQLCEPLIQLCQEVDNSVFDVTPPDSYELESIIRKPVEIAGLRFEIDGDGRGLDEFILQEAKSNAGVLPFLGCALARLYSQDSDKGTLTYSSYEADGCLRGSIERHAEQAISSYVRYGLLFEKAFSEVMHDLVALTNDLQPARKLAVLQWSGRSNLANDLLGALIEGRIAVASNSASMDQPQVSLVHDILLTEWSRLSRWLSDSKQILAIKSQMESDSRLWEAANRPRDLLASGGTRLVYARQADTLPISDTITAEYLRESIREANRRSSFRFRCMVVYDAVATLVCWEGLHWFRFSVPDISLYYRIEPLKAGIVVIVQLVAFFLLRMYDFSWRRQNGSILRPIISSPIVGLLLMVLALGVAGLLETVPRFVLVLYPVVLPFFLMIPRAFIKDSKR